jgi:membrane protein
MAPPSRIPPSASPLAAARGAVNRIVRGLLGFSARVYRKAGQDDIFFLAGGIAFNLLLGAIPFFILLVAIFTQILSIAVDDPVQAVTEYVLQVLPRDPDIELFIERQITLLLDTKFETSIIGIILLVWVSTRLFGSLRSALRSVFDLQEERGIIAGKLFDLKMVVIAGTLFAANTAITVILEAVQNYGFQLVGLTNGGVVRTLNWIYVQLLAYTLIFLMYFLIYRYLPVRRIPWRIAAVGAAFSSVLFELLKSAFAFYVSHLANYGSAYGYAATTVVVVFWVYYSAVVFVLGGEVGQVYDLYRTRRRQRELLD